LRRRGRARHGDVQRRETIAGAFGRSVWVWGYAAGVAAAVLVTALAYTLPVGLTVHPDLGS